MNKGLFTFKKSERLKKRKFIEALFKDGKALSYFPFKCIFIIQNSDNTSSKFRTHFGISIPKRKIRQAVQRNLLKRRTREAWRLQKSILNDSLIQKNVHLNIFFIYQSTKIEPFSKIEKAIEELIPKLDKEIQSFSLKNV